MDQVLEELPYFHLVHVSLVYLTTIFKWHSVIIHPKQMVHIAIYPKVVHIAAHHDITDYTTACLHMVLHMSIHWSHSSLDHWCLRAPKTHVSIRHQLADIMPCLVFSLSPLG